jgi:predicted O-methyltransferase YrrM
MISKFILPWFGGSPAVWTTAMLFFQCVLCAGYVYAHALTRLPSRQWQAGIHVTLLVLGALLASAILPDSSWKPSGEEAPALKVLLILGASVGLPYFCLATTGPLVQHWFSHTSQTGSVYRLYALSNIGSFAALLSFPYLFEPWFDLQQMSRWWGWGFGLFVLLCLPIALGWGQQASAPQAVKVPQETSDHPEVTWWMRLRWLLLPALASLIFISATDQVSHHIAPEPSLWIATLGLYLLTFVLTFDHPRWYRPALTAVLAMAALLVTTGRKEIPALLNFEWEYGVAEMRLMHYALLFLVCMMCHGELYRQRPRNTRYLTEFFLWMSVGGAFGGLFVALFATHFFNEYHEWPIAMTLAIVLAFGVLRREWGGSSVGLAFLVFVSFYMFIEDPFEWREGPPTDYVNVALDQSRNFYGTVAVNERQYPQNPERNYRVFYSGQITHGMQFQSADKRYQPATYYGVQSGVGETMNYLHQSDKPLHVGLIGLGAGTLANYARAQDHFDFFEINPEVVRVAQKWFDNLSAIKTRDLRIILGDARLQMERLPATTQYDVIVLDAFTGGSVPIHLLTQEAFQIYKAHLKPQGFIIIHITNAFLNLYPVVKDQAQALGLGYRNKFQDLDRNHLVRRNQYFIMTQDATYLKDHPSVSRELRDEQGQVIGVENRDRPGLRLWTDQFSSMHQIQW